MHRQRKNTNLGVGESLKLKSRLLFHKALYGIGSFNAFASALVPKTLVLNLQPSSYVIPYVPQNIFPFWEANNKTHGTEINQKKKSNTYQVMEEKNWQTTQSRCTYHRKPRQVLDVCNCWHVIFNHAHHKIHFTEIKNTQYKNPLDANVTH